MKTTMGYPEQTSFCACHCIWSLQFRKKIYVPGLATHNLLWYNVMCVRGEILCLKVALSTINQSIIFV